MIKLLQTTFLILLLFVTAQLGAQDRMQRIRGRVVDKESLYPISAATIRVWNQQEFITGAISDESGYYKTELIPIGRYDVSIEFVGYEPAFFTNIIIGSGKETELIVELAESNLVIEGVVVKSTDNNFANHVNESGLVSNRLFNAEETERYVGSRQDPARMALNFAGAQATDDSRNDIVVRGNSPLGLLWRYEDVELPNPNHFAVAGASGGPISVFNNKVIGKSDFMTGAFPAGFGNALSGAFDMRMRNGNTERFEQTFQFGLFGTELALEGPINKKNKASYIAAYRYSTLQLFDKLNVPLGTNAIPNYQDATFKVNIPTAKHGTFAFFGIGGLSNIDIVLSKFDEPQEELYGKKDRDQYFTTKMGMLGASHKYHINKTTMSKLTLSVSGSDIGGNHNLINRLPDFTLDPNNPLSPVLFFKMIESKSSLAWSLRKKVSTKLNFVAGVYMDAYRVNYTDSIYNQFTNLWELRMDYKGGNAAVLVQPYVQFNYKYSDRFLLTGGLHTQYFAMSNSVSVEPRVAMKYGFNPKQSLSLGAGLHSRMQPMYVYFYQKRDANDNFFLHNQNLDFTRSMHFVLSYDHVFTKYFRIKAETYYQYLYNVPVDKLSSSSFSLLNMGSGFDRFFPDELINDGTGNNYGLELTVERNFYKNYYLLATGSLFESNYRGSDGVQRNTDFNGRFASRAMVGYEKAVGKSKQTSLNFGGGVTYAGGRRYSPVDIDSSIRSADVVYDDSKRNTLQFKDFFRVDVRLGFKVEAKKVSHEFVLDIINLLNTRNILTLTYDPEIALTRPNDNPLVEQPQLNRLPVFFYKIHF